MGSNDEQEFLLKRPDGTQVWFKVAGPATGQAPVLYLHGGPGYNSFSFEKSVGPKLEQQLAMIYIDQRGGNGRSAATANSDLSIAAIVADIDAIRQKLRLDKLNIVAHSFGGLVALEYLQAFPKHIEKLVLVDISANLQSAFEYQLRSAREAFPEHEKQWQQLFESQSRPSEKLQLAYAIVGRLPLQRHLMFAADSAQQTAEKLDQALPITNSQPQATLFRNLQAANYLDSAHADLLVRLPVPARVFAGQRSEVIGRENIEAAAQAWGAPIVWFEDSGHFVYLEEPERFVRELVQFFAPLPN